ncbi:short-chain dehydrogenase [Psychrobacter sp. 4Dc]|mgnify:CR=1 FL=1|uniref:short-chain dehydrogenase n=1 Tax=Psychrobacter sp. 4Dc TaxID=888437 RepID=UPI000CC2259C|nr:short-chain dehydrogenase [Psychrobacter sp. 4Dc]PKH64158.1 short-chain dehydrogenase [Psychrobacter sp. 4Dc]|tara:strand:+ start:241 stop:1041 length:801 start_codon:yes stop_codon:yes gene_type:complete
MDFSLEAFLFDTPLYTKITIKDLKDAEFKALITNQDARNDIDGYNPFRKTQTTFETIRTLGHLFNPSNHYLLHGGFGEFQIRCKRYGNILRYYCLYDAIESTLMKVGQYPSVATIHLHEIKQYKKLLSTEKMKEITRAIGLAANGVGIGSFVYLRRVFEYLIQQAYQEAIENKSISEGDFQRARMDGKIELLKAYLPTFLVDHKELYSILSLGIHELDENTCLENFDTLKVGIEIILDEQLEALKKKEKIDAATAKIKNLKSTIKK